MSKFNFTTPLYKYTKCCLFLLIISLYAPLIYSTIFLIIITGAFILETLLNKQRIAINNWQCFFFLLPLAYILNSLIFGFDQKVLQKLLRVIPFIILPVIIGNLRLKKSEVEGVFHSFIITSLLFVIVSVAVVSYNYWITETREYLLTIEKTLLVGQVSIPKIFKFHTPYICLYLLTAQLLSFKLFLKNKSWAYFVFGLLFLISIAYFSGRSALILSLILLCLYPIHSFNNLTKRNAIVFRFLSLSIFLLITFIVLNFFPLVHEKFWNISKTGFGVFYRLELINSVLSVINWNNCFFGLGLLKYKETLSPFMGGGQITNLHNQYLEIFVSMGVFGLSLFILLKYRLLKLAICQKSLVCVLFIVFFSMLEFTESLLYRQRGIVLFCVILPILINRKTIRG